MATSHLNIRIDSELRNQASIVFENYGLTPAQAIKLFFNQVVSTNQIPLSFDYHNLKPTKKLEKAISEAQNSELTTYDNLDAFIKAFK